MISLIHSHSNKHNCNYNSSTGQRHHHLSHHRPNPYHHHLQWMLFVKLLLIMTCCFTCTVAFASSSVNTSKSVQQLQQTSSNCKKHKNKRNVVVEDLRIALCGGLAGATGTVLLYPFDTAKTLRQSQPSVYKNVWSALSSLFIYNHQNHHINAANASKKNWFIDGTRLAYSGVWTSTLGAVPSSAMYFGGYEFTKRRLEHKFLSDYYRNKSIDYTYTGTKNEQTQKIMIETSSTAVLPLQKRLCIHSLAAATGNAVSSLVFVPKEYIKQQMQSQCRGLGLRGATMKKYGVNIGKAQTAKAASAHPNSILAVTSSNVNVPINKSMHAMIYEVVQTKGISELYSGYRATLMRNVPSAILRFALYEELKLRFTQDDLEGKEVICYFISTNEIHQKYNLSYKFIFTRNISNSQT